MNEAENTADRALVVQLELYLDRRPPSGRLRSRQGVEDVFVGWLGFVEALRRMQALDQASAGTAGLLSPTDRREMG